MSTSSVFNMCSIIYNIKRLKKLKHQGIITCITLAFLSGYLVALSVHFYLPVLDFALHGRLEDISCHKESDDTLPRADGSMFLPPARSIFFHKTSCEPGLNSRQACAVESAARAHPEWQINVLFAAPVTRYALKTGSLAVLRKYHNVELFRVDVDKYARRTPMENMIAGALMQSRWPVLHASDMFRYLSLYKFGGMILDLDVVVAKGMDLLGRNWGVRETDYTVGAGVIAFSRDEIGRSMAEAAIRDLRRNYRGDIWGNNGPGVITRILQEQCSTTKPFQMSAATCNGFEVYGNQFFYPVAYWKASEYFEPGEIVGEDVAYVHHVWNRLSSELQVHKDSPYAKLARKYCPNIYKLYDKDFGI